MGAFSAMMSNERNKKAAEKDEAPKEKEKKEERLALGAKPLESMCRDIEQS